MKSKAKRRAAIRTNAEVLWEEPPGHFGGAYSKMLARPENVGSRLVDYRISVYQPKAYVAPHRHKVQEQIYYILEGEGLMEIDGARTPVGPLTTIFLPPGVEHAIYNTGVTDLRFIVVTCPPEDE
jgi:mannose-6-phosphate isomerase-like protein (cupin superfamily)